MEVFYLAGLAFLPLIFSILITAIIHNNFLEGVRIVISPGEIMTFTVSFTAPTIFFFIKSHGESFKLPALKFISFVTVLIYFLAFCILLIAKNNWVPQLSLNSLKESDKLHGHVYIYASLILMVLSMFLWFYRVYYSAKFSDFVKEREQQQNQFNTLFSASLDQN